MEEHHGLYVTTIQGKDAAQIYGGGTKSACFEINQLHILSVLFSDALLCRIVTVKCQVNVGSSKMQLHCC